MLPIQFYWNVGTAIQVAVDLTLEANGKGRFFLAISIDPKSHTATTVNQIARSADQALAFSHAESSSTREKVASGDWEASTSGS